MFYHCNERHSSQLNWNTKRCSWDINLNLNLNAKSTIFVIPWKSHWNECGLSEQVRREQDWASSYKACSVMDEFQGLRSSICSRGVLRRGLSSREFSITSRCLAVLSSKRVEEGRETSVSRYLIPIHCRGKPPTLANTQSVHEIINFTVRMMLITGVHQ